MDTARYRAFLAAVDTGSFTRAAEVLNYSTSGVSQLIQSLEQDLGRFHSAPFQRCSPQEEHLARRLEPSSVAVSAS